MGMPDVGRGKRNHGLEDIGGFCFFFIVYGIVSHLFIYTPYSCSPLCRDAVSLIGLLISFIRLTTDMFLLVLVPCYSLAGKLFGRGVGMWNW